MSTKIEWTDETWNPVTGCSKVSQGCKNCYAERLWPKVEGARVNREGGAPRPFTHVSVLEDRLSQPLRWKTPRLVFVNSMSDLLHEAVPYAFLDKVFAVMRRAREHTFQILTKRQDRLLAYLSDPKTPERVFVAGHEVPLCATDRLPTWPLPNVWIGVSVEDQATADARIPLLLLAPAAVRWISAEPLLGPINLNAPIRKLINAQVELIDAWRAALPYAGKRLDWVVAGGESGPGARPMHPDWARSLRDQCAAAGVPFFFKQWGAFRIGEYDPKSDASIRWQDGATEWYGDHADIKYSDSWFDGVIAWPASKKTTGRLLDGRTHDEYPA